MVAILGYSRKQILAAVTDMYTAVADAPTGSFHFPVGRAACRMLGYPAELLAALPEPVLSSFAGVGFPFRADVILPGDAVLDIGAGAGSDTFIAGSLVGPHGLVLALDMTPAMTRKLRRASADHGSRNVAVIQASAERLPFRDGCVDAITSNGVLNLVPDKRTAVAEMFRVLRPGGWLQIADIVIRRPVTTDCHADPKLWAECVVGATVEEDFLQLFCDAGFESVEVLHRHDYFSHSPSAHTRAIAASFGARSIEVRMRRGAAAPARLRAVLRRMAPRRIAAALRRRGIAGVLATAVAVLACYGPLLAITLLSLLGVGLVLNELIWSAVIGGFALLAVAVVAAGVVRRHRPPWPTLVGTAGGMLLLYTLFIAYHWLAELLGFVLLATAVYWDFRLRQREDARLLGLVD